MGYDRQAARRPIELALNGDLVAQARTFTGDLGATIERLLSDFVEREAHRRDRDVALDRTIDAVNELHRKTGLLSDEFPSF